jgi:hypothetical protein
MTDIQALIDKLEGMRNTFEPRCTAPYTQGEVRSKVNGVVDMAQQIIRQHFAEQPLNALGFPIPQTLDDLMTNKQPDRYSEGYNKGSDYTCQPHTTPAHGDVERIRDILHFHLRTGVFHNEVSVCGIDEAAEALAAMQPAPVAPQPVYAVDERALFTLVNNILCEFDHKGDMRSRIADVIRPYLRPAEPVDLLEAIKALAPFEVVQGDAIHRTNPSSQQVVNSNAAWAVSNAERSAHKIRKHVDVLNTAANIKWKE